MNLEKFDELYKNNKDKINVDDLCDYEQHEKKGKLITRQPARRNIMKNDKDKFICRECYIKYFHHMITKSTERRNSNEIVEVICPYTEHTGNRIRTMKKSCYFGSLNKKPYEQLCKSCMQLGKIISQEQINKISAKLTGREVSQEQKEKLSNYMKNNPEGKERARKNLSWSDSDQINKIRINKIIESRKEYVHSEETKDKISKSRKGQTLSEETKTKISISRKALFASERGEEIKKRLSIAATQQNNSMNVAAFVRKGFFFSNKNKCEVVYQSSYELRFCFILENDDTVESYETQGFFEIEKGARRYDFLIKYKNSSIKHLIETKSKKFLQEERIVNQIKELEKFAKDNNYEFSILTEDEFGMTSHEIRDWADKFMESNPNIVKPSKLVTLEMKKRKNALKQKKHYENKIKNNKIKIYCEYCQEEHEILQISYDMNIKKNNRYICHKENADKPKPREIKFNLLAEQKLKICSDCKQTKPYTEFHSDSSRSDGLASKCKSCRLITKHSNITGIKYDITKDFLIKEYVENHRSAKNIALEVGCSEDNIRIYLKKYGIPSRSNAKNLIGQKFNMLTVMENAGYDKVKNVLWKCQCDCGEFTFAPTNQLTSGHKKSCGCQKYVGSVETITKYNESKNKS